MSVRDTLSKTWCRAERRLRQPRELRAQKILKGLEYAPISAVEDFQKDRLHRLIGSAAKTPYYQDLFKRVGAQAGDIRTFKDLSALPTLTKTIIQDRLSDLLDPSAPALDRIKNKSGGSTGVPTTFYQDREHWRWNLAAAWLGLEWCGFSPGERHTYLWGSIADLPASNGRIKVRHYLENKLFENAFQISEERLKMYTDRLRQWKPKFLFSYVSSAVLLARYVSEHHLPVRFQSIRTTAETLTPAQRELLASTFQSEVYDEYGSREMGSVAQECSAHQGLHLYSPNRFVEIVPIPGASFGRLVITNLVNGVLPFIRYETDDLAEWAEGSCPCGRTWRRLKKVIGRVTDVVMSPSGKWIPGEFFPHLFTKIEGVREYQVIQEDRQTLRVRVVFIRKDEQLTKKCFEFFERMVHQELDPAFRIQFETVDRIETSPSGKLRFIISKLNPLAHGS